jgi:hypothetical protein
LNDLATQYAELLKNGNNALISTLAKKVLDDANKRKREAEERAEREEKQEKERIEREKPETPEIPDPPKKQTGKPQTAPKPANFRITDDNLGAYGAKTRFRNNTAAIRTMLAIEAEQRPATAAEQETLSRYTGWGAIQQAFDSKIEPWKAEYAELKGLLSDKEYAAARATVLNAHYTSPTVIKAVYSALLRMGLGDGNPRILEPSCGVGNFFGLLPEELGAASLYGVEIDGITGRIARLLYPQAEITVSGFEKTDFKHGYFDDAVGNVPFGNYQIFDAKYNQSGKSGLYSFFIHDYFFVKTLDLVREGGIIAFLTSKGTLDKADKKAREYIAKKADLIGAVRLPNNAFKANAGTEVTIDIIFLRKRGEPPETPPNWINITKTEDGLPINTYFAENPRMILGKMARDDRMYGNNSETSCLPIDGADLAEQLNEAVLFLPENVFVEPPKAPEPQKPEKPEKIKTDKTKDSPEAIPDVVCADDYIKRTVKDFSFTLLLPNEPDERGGVHGGKIGEGYVYFRDGFELFLVKEETARISALIGLRDCARGLIEVQINGGGDEAVKARQAELNALYDAFTAEYGLINDRKNKAAFSKDSGYYLLCSLEKIDEDGNLESKADMFTKRTINRREAATHVETANEALAVSLGEKACVDLGFMASLMGGSEKIEDIVRDLQGVIFKDPETGSPEINLDNPDWCKGWQTAD